MLTEGDSGRGPASSSMQDCVTEACRVPLPLYRSIADNPLLRADVKEPPKVAAAFETVVPWHLWSATETSDCHGVGGGRGSSHPSTLGADILGSHVEIDCWSCDIRDIAGLATSEAYERLMFSRTLDEMAELEVGFPAEPATEDQLRKHLEWHERRIGNRGSLKDHLFCHLWDGRLFLFNHGGSRHFVAARHIAGRLGIAVPVRTNLHLYGIRPEVVGRLRRAYEVFVLAGEATAWTGFLEAMRRFGVTHLRRRMPGYPGMHAVLLPRAEPRSMRVAMLLRRSGYFDLGDHLGRLAEKSMEAGIRFSTSCRFSGDADTSLAGVC